jgi:hypothetical protein
VLRLMTKFPKGVMVGGAQIAADLVLSRSEDWRVSEDRRELECRGATGCTVRAWSVAGSRLHTAEHTRQLRASEGGEELERVFHSVALDTHAIATT